MSDVFDLHAFAPRDAKAAVEAYLEQAHRNGIHALRIIHGRGIGVQRDMVRKVLARTPFVTSFSDAPMEAGGWGATIVTLGTPGDPPMAPTVQLNDELAGLIRQYDAALAEAEALAAPLNTSQFNWRSEPAKWSVGQCLEHLTLSAGSYLPKLQAAIEDGRRRGLTASPPFRYGWFESFFLRSLEPPPKLRVKAPKVFQPDINRPVLDPASTLASYKEVNRAGRDLIEQAQGLDLRRIKVPSPVTSLLHWSIGIVFAIAPAHDRRHLWQARQVIANPAFPRRAA